MSGIAIYVEGGGDYTDQKSERDYDQAAGRKWAATGTPPCHSQPPWRPLNLRPQPG